MFAGTKGCCGLFGVQRCRSEQRYGIDVPGIQHRFQIAGHRIYAGFRLSLFKRYRVDIAETGQSATGMASESIHPRPAEPQADYGDVELVQITLLIGD